VSNATSPRISALPQKTSTDNDAVLYVAHATEGIPYVAIAQELPDFRTAVQQCLSQLIENGYCDRSLENQDLAMTLIWENQDLAMTLIWVISLDSRSECPH
jgi:hypothetical protein